MIQQTYLFGDTPKSKIEVIGDTYHFPIRITKIDDKSDYSKYGKDEFKLLEEKTKIEITREEATQLMIVLQKILFHPK